MIWTKQPIKTSIEEINNKVVFPTDLGNFASESDLISALNTKLNGMQNNEVSQIRFQMTSATASFKAYVYTGVLTRITNQYASLNVTVCASYAAALCVVGSKNTNWKFEELALQSSVASFNSIITALSRHTRLTDFSLSELQAAVVDQNLAAHGLKPGDEKTINGHTYVIAGLNVMKGTYGTGHTCLSNHVGLIVIPHTTHAWNASGKTNEGADDRGAGYYYCDLQYYLENDVMAMCNTDLGSDHLYSHKKAMGSAINTSGFNRLGKSTGCTSSYKWKDCYISALTEAQVFGGDHWGSSGYDAGEANIQLPVFAEYKHTEIFKNEYPWLRDVSSATQACMVSQDGNESGEHGVDRNRHVAGLILYH